MAVHIFLYIFQFNVFIVNYTEFPVRPSDTRDRGEVLTSPKLNNFIQSYSCLVKVKSQVYRVIVRFYFLFVCLLQKKMGVYGNVYEKGTIKRENLNVQDQEEEHFLYISAEHF